MSIQQALNHCEVLVPRNTLTQTKAKSTVKAEPCGAAVQDRGQSGQESRGQGTNLSGVRWRLRGTAWKGKEEKLILEDMSLVQVLGLGLSSWVPLDAGTIQAAGTWD